MKKTYRYMAVIIMFVLLFSTGACSGNDEEKKTLAEFTSISYDSVETVDDMNKYASDTNKGGIGNDDPVDNGIVNCVYYTLKINGLDVPVYTTRCAIQPHSFAWVDAITLNVNSVLEVELTTKSKYKSAVVLPESSGVKAEVINDKVTATLIDYGSFSFAFNNSPQEALTIYVAPKEELKVPEGWNTVRFSPRKFDDKELILQDTQTAYIFEKGRYEISTINIPSDCIIWFESGTYIDVYAASATDWQAALQCYGASNIVIGGRSLFDFSSVQGGDLKVKGVFNFNSIQSAKFSGVISINSNSWSLCFTDSVDVQISRCMLFGYRTYSDGIMLSDCKDSGAKYCFLRTGDDAIETKSTGTKQTDNILYENNAVWTDKANAYGAIYEANNSMKNVTFRNCSVGFAQPTWSPMLGCLVVQMGDNKNTVWEDIHFENIEVYRNDCALMNISLRDPEMNGLKGGQAKNIYFKNIVSKRCYGYPFRIHVQRGGQLGMVFLDNIKYNNTALQESDIDKMDIMSIANVNNWSKEKNVKINTLI